MTSRALTFSELEQVLSETSFHDNWEISLWPGEYEGIRIRFLVKGLLDSYDRSRLQTLGVNDFLPPMFSVEQFLRWLVWRIERIASHEVREHFAYKGEAIFDPHHVWEEPRPDRKRCSPSQPVMS